MKNNNLQYLLSPWIHNVPNKNITNLIADSRMLNIGDLFIATPGIKQDGRNYVLEAIKKKPAAILFETTKKKTWNF